MALDTPTNSSVVVQSQPLALDGVYQQILSRLKQNDYSDDDIFAVHLAFEEAFLNAVKHGNKMNPSKTVTVEYTVNTEKTTIIITDEGKGFNPGGVPDPRLDENLYQPEGRGLLLINAYMDVVEYNDRGNRVYMARFRSQPDADAKQDAV
jgi:serine/threonine-protein kinase RsbW